MKQMQTDYSTWIPKIIDIAERASAAIAQIFERNTYQIKTKLDKSPVTEADLLSQEIIQEGLFSLDPNIPMISEEIAEVPFETRKQWPRFWLVDPLDGTREFIRGSKEFTINIALIEANEPVLGVVAVPMFRHVYWSVKKKHNNYHHNHDDNYERAAYFRDENGVLGQIHSRAKIEFPIRIALSQTTLERFEQAVAQGIAKEVAQDVVQEFAKKVAQEVAQGDSKDINIDSVDNANSAKLKHFYELNDLLKRIQSYELKFIGSALKICLVARGDIDLYPRFGKTGEWDTAAGQCILEAAGGRLVDTSGRALKYNERPTLINPPFYAVNCVDLLSYIVDK